MRPSGENPAQKTAVSSPAPEGLQESARTRGATTRTSFCCCGRETDQDNQRGQGEAQSHARGSLCVRVCASRHLLGHGDRRLGESGRTQRPRAPAAPEQRSARQQGQASVKGSVRGPWPCPEAGDGHPAWMVPRPSGTRPGPGLSPEAAQSPAQTLPKGGQRPSFCVLIFAGWGETCWSRR